MRFVSLLAGLALVAPHTLAQTQAPVTLDRRLARAPTAYTEIVALQELPDGRAIAVDLRERRIALIDFAAGTARDIAREGGGPTEFTGTFSATAWLGDTVLVYGRQDLLKIAPNGVPAGKIPVALLRAGGGGLGVPRFADRDGRLYFERTAPLERGADGNFVAALNGYVTRWNPRTGQADSLVRTWLRNPAQALVRPWRPYPAKDGVAVLPDGRIVIARATDYRIEIWRDSVRLVEGPRQPYAPIAIGADERNAFRDERARRPAGATVSGPPTAAPATPAEREAARRRLNLPDEAFPPAMPPFVEDRPVLVDRTGHIWVARTWRARDTDRLYDVFDDRGQLVRRYVLRNRGRVVGFGKDVVYVVTPDDDDLEWIERFALTP